MAPPVKDSPFLTEIVAPPVKDSPFLTGKKKRIGVGSAKSRIPRRGAAWCGEASGGGGVREELLSF